MSKELLFVDTNILLDFYRVRSDTGLHLLNRIDSLHDHIVRTAQVEMEFKSNRQRVICESLNALKPPQFSFSPPAFLHDTKTVEIINRRMVDTKNRLAQLKKRLKRVMEKPALYDPV